MVAKEDPEIPTDKARVRIEKGDLEVELLVPNDQSPDLLRTIIWVAAGIVLLVGPAITLKAMPPEYPLWAAVTMVLAQIIAVVYLATKFRTTPFVRRT